MWCRKSFERKRRNTVAYFTTPRIRVEYDGEGNHCQHWYGEKLPVESQGLFAARRTNAGRQAPRDPLCTVALPLKLTI